MSVGFVYIAPWYCSFCNRYVRDIMLVRLEQCILSFLGYMADLGSSCLNLLGLTEKLFKVTMAVDNLEKFKNSTLIFYVNGKKVKIIVL